MLSRADILGLLDELAALLDAQGIHGDLFVVGGAAMALAYNARRATRDLDGVFEPKQVIYQAAENIAHDHGLPPDWLNDSVKSFLPATIPKPQCCSIAPDCRFGSPLLATYSP